MPIPNYKDIVDLMKMGLTIEAQEKILEWRVGAMELQEENLKLREKIASLESEIAASKSMKHDGTLYYAEGDRVPFCSICFEKDKKRIHVVRTDFGSWYCQACLTDYPDR